jgi:hypothetical protein
VAFNTSKLTYRSQLEPVQHTSHECSGRFFLGPKRMRSKSNVIVILYVCCGALVLHCILVSGFWLFCFAPLVSLHTKIEVIWLYNLKTLCTELYIYLFYYFCLSNCAVCITINNCAIFIFISDKEYFQKMHLRNANPLVLCTATHYTFMEQLAILLSNFIVLYLVSLISSSVKEDIIKSVVCKLNK